MRNRVTYKGPKLDQPDQDAHRNRVSLADGDKPAEDYCKLSRASKYRPTAVVRKERSPISSIAAASH